MLSSGIDSDFTIFILDTDGNKIEKKVHKLIIKQCPYFSAMLDLKGKETHDGSVTIDNISKDTMESVLNYMYTTELIDMSMDQARDLASAADYLQLTQLKRSALEKWKISFFKTTDANAIIDEFRQLVEASSRIGIKIDNSWHNVVETVLAAMFINGSEYNIADESNAMMEFLIDYFGPSHPLVSLHLLDEWTKNSIDQTQVERKQLTALWIKKINMHDFSLRTLVRVSKSPVLPLDYVLKILQEKADVADLPVDGEVTYNVTLRTNSVFELEHETGFSLFSFHGFDRTTKLAWQFLRIPANCLATVTLESTYSGNEYAFNEMRVEWDEYQLDDFLDQSGRKICLKIMLAPLQKSKEKRAYDIELNT